MERRIAVLFNPRAGALLALGADAARERLSTLLKARGYAPELRAFDPGTVRRDVDALLAASPQRLLVAGGDGTVLGAAAAIGERPVALGILPCGTMNVLARDLGIPEDGGIEGALDAVLDGEPVRIDVASLNGQPFLCSSVIGLMPHLGRLREKARDGAWRKWFHLLPRAWHLLRHYPRLRIRLQVDGTTHVLRSRALAVSNNALCAGEALLPMRERLDTGRLAVYVARDESAFDLLGLAARLLAGRWRDDMRLRRFEDTRIVIDVPRLTLISVMNDGEATQVQTPLRYDIAARALCVLRPVREARAAA